MPKLERTLVDTCVVVGIDQNVELEPCRHSEFEDSGERYGPYRQHILAVCNETLAYFPEATKQVDGSPFYKEDEVVCPQARAENDTNDVRELPFAMEIIENLPTFCFPLGGYVYTSGDAYSPEITYLVLTNVDGERTYAVCMTYLEHYVAVKRTLSEGTVELKNANPTEDGFTQEGRVMGVFAPLCVCLVSSFPYFNTMKDCLSSLLAQIKIIDGQLTDWRVFMKLATTLTLIPVPPAGPLAVRFSMFTNEHTVYPPLEADRRVIDFDIHLPLLIFTPEVIVEIVTCLLTQQRMVFIGSSFSLLTVIIESFLTFIDPIKYVHTYVPTLPNRLGDLLEAPGQFIMGVHTSLKQQVKVIRRQAETPNIVLVDIDSGKIDLGKECDLPPMPDIVAQSLIVRLKKISPHLALKLVAMPTVFTYKDILEQHQDLICSIHSEIRTTFLDMLVSLFGDVFSYMSVGKQYFDRHAFVQSHNEDEQGFFEGVVYTDAFRQFVNDRLERHEMRDEFAVLGERIAQRRRSDHQSFPSSSFQRTRTRSQVQKRPQYEYFSVPLHLEESLSTGKHFKDYTNDLTTHLKSVDLKSIRLRASYTYLRGFAHIACDDPIEGLRDFHALYSSAPELFPKAFSQEIIGKLDPLVLSRLQSESFYKETITFRTFTNQINFQMENLQLKLLDAPIDKSEFEKRWKPLRAAVSSELAEWLFNKLSPDGELIPHDTYNEFYKLYNSLKQPNKVNEVIGVRLDTSDHVLSISSLVTTERGMGRLILTENSLYFIRDGEREERLITPLCDIKEVLSYQQNAVFFSGVKALRIVNSDKNKPSFYACLKEERDTWGMFLQELNYGHKSAILLREKNMVNIAVNNVMVVQVLLQMKYALKDTEDAFYFIKREAIESQSISDDAKEALEIRLDPCLFDKSRTTVWSIAYVPGNALLHEPPSIWVGMGSGAIVVYETEKWNYVSELRYAKKRISRLLHLVGTKQIWAASIDTVIYVINTETRVLEQQLQKHKDFVSEIIAQYRASEIPNGETQILVWSSSCNGQIVCWDPEVRETVRAHRLEKVRTLNQIIMVDGMYLWCVTNDEIIVVDTASENFNILKKLVIQDNNGFKGMLGCAFKVSEQSIWMSSKFSSPGSGVLHIWDTQTFRSKPVDTGSEVQVCCMATAYGSVWVGDKDGRIIVMATDGCSREREFHVHEDMVKSMCETPEGHIVSGSGSKEGKVCVWNAISDFDVVDGRRKWVSRKSIAEVRENYEIVPIVQDMFASFNSP